MTVTTHQSVYMFTCVTCPSLHTHTHTHTHRRTQQTTTTHQHTPKNTPNNTHTHMHNQTIVALQAVAMVDMTCKSDLLSKPGVHPAQNGFTSKSTHQQTKLQWS